MCGEHLHARITLTSLHRGSVGKVKEMQETRLSKQPPQRDRSLRSRALQPRFLTAGTFSDTIYMAESTRVLQLTPPSTGTD